MVVSIEALTGSDPINELLGTDGKAISLPESTFRPSVTLSLTIFYFRYFKILVFDENLLL